MTTRIKEWERQFTRHVQLTTTLNQDIFNKAVTELHKRIVDRTPVGDPSLWNWPAHKDYVPGTLKAAWTLENNGKYAKIENSTPYGYRVEAQSWSTQAPTGMMRISVLEWRDILRAMTSETTK